MDEMTNRVLAYTNKMWDRIMHVSEQNDWVDVGQ